jgi:hypothetical protein
MLDRVVLAHELERRCVVEVLPLATDLLMRFGQQRDGLAPAVAPFLAARNTALRGFQCAFGFAIPAGRKAACAIRKRGARLTAEVKTGLLTRRGQGPYWYVRTGEADLPAVGFSASRDTVTVWGVPSNGRDQRTATRPILERIRTPLSSVAPSPTSLADLFVGAGVPALAALRAWEACLFASLHATEVGLIGLSKSRQHVL